MKQAGFLLVISSLSIGAKEIVTPKRTITITNKISQQMTTYTLLGADYIPEFDCLVNGTLIEHGCKAEIPVVDNTFTVKYRYNFPQARGLYKGAKEIIFEIAPDKKECDLEFSWQDSWRVIASQAKPKKIKKVNYSA
jgi:hypothetical protein